MSTDLTPFDYAPLGNSADTFPWRIAEDWRAIDGFPLYEISNQGRVRSLRFGKLKLLSPSESPQGYFIAKLSRSGVCFSVSVHSLVCRAFIGERPPGYQINHVNGIKSFNWADNLEYATPKENTRHAHRSGLVGKRKERGVRA